MNRFWSDFVTRLQPYTPGEQPQSKNLVKLNTNESPYGPSPRVLAAIQAQSTDDLRLYPPPNAEYLKQAIAHYHGVKPDQVFVGNGSDEVLAHVFNGFFRQSKPILFPDISYSFYPVFCQLYGIEYQQVPLDDEFALPIAAFDRPNGGIVFPNPNAPTGRLLGLQQIQELLERHGDSLVVVDEAYVDFGGVSAIELISDYDNLLVVHTLSKSRSLAGLRVGYAVGEKSLIEGLDRIKNSFNSYPLGHLQIAAAVASFEDDDYFLACTRRVIASREALTDALLALDFSVIPSAANFVFVTHSKWKAAALADALRQRDIIVRYFDKPRIRAYLRITVGAEAENALLIEALRDIVDSEG